MEEQMKKKNFISIIVLIAVIFVSEKTSVKAANIIREDYCKESTIERKDQTNKYYWNYNSIKDDKKYIIDYFQDPDKNGVSLTVTISALDVIATYWKWETVDVCMPYKNYQLGMTQCSGDTTNYPGYYFYLAPQRKCVQQPPEVTYRPIETGTLSIWLEPTIGTRDLLGPGPYLINSNKPVVRYLYPDQWAPEFAQSGKLTIIENPWFRNSDDIEEFLRENKDFLLLDTSFKDFDLTSRMSLTQSPIGKGNALSLFGTRDQCHADIKGYTDFDGHEVCSMTATEEKTGYGNKYITVKFDRIPLDEPGEWYIGVSFYQSPAKYDGGRGVENMGIGVWHKFEYSDETLEKQFSFESYIIRSAPCNPDEFDNCWEEKKKDTPGG
jgi:hypothetical protein